MSISEGTYIVYNLNSGGMSVEKYDAWKVLNILKDAGMTKVHYKPLTPAEIKHFSASLFGQDPAKVAKIKVVYFTGDKEVAIKALKESGISKRPEFLRDGIADHEVKKYIEKPKGKRDRAKDSGDWDDGLTHKQYETIVEIKKRGGRLPRWALRSSLHRHEVLAHVIEARIESSSVK